MDKQTIIILEDAEPLREFYSTVLEAHGYQVVQAGNSYHITKLIEEHQPVLIITDMIMPEHEGMEGIFNIIQFSNTPIIAISAHPKYLDMISGVVAMTLLKPIIGDQLIAGVNQVLGNQAIG